MESLWDFLASVIAQVNSLSYKYKHELKIRFCSKVISCILIEKWCVHTHACLHVYAHITHTYIFYQYCLFGEVWLLIIPFWTGALGSLTSPFPLLPALGNHLTTIPLWSLGFYYYMHPTQWVCTVIAASHWPSSLTMNTPKLGLPSLGSVAWSDAILWISSSFLHPSCWLPTAFLLLATGLHTILQPTSQLMFGFLIL